MSSAPTPFRPSSPHAARAGLFAGLILLGAVLTGGALALAGLVRLPDAGASQAAATGEAKTEGGEDNGVVTFEPVKWPAAGLRVEPATRGPLTETFWRPGKVMLDERRVAHLSPMVEGIVRAVRARIGQRVKAGEILVVLESKELGQAKLALVKARLALTAASADHDWVKTTAGNTAELLGAMVDGGPVAPIEARFRGRAIGDWRQQLVTAYARRIQTKAALANIEQIAGQGAVSQVSLRSSRTEYETAEAVYQALREELHFRTRQQLRIAEQKLREARTQVSVVETTLVMFGLAKDEVEKLDPVGEKATIAHYAIRAPFDGAVLALHTTLAERAGPQAPVAEFGDLTQLWMRADLAEHDLPATHGLPGQSVTFKGPGLPGPRSAEVFHVGDVVDKQTRTVPLFAMADNADGRLKPGMYVDVQLRRGPADPVVHVPAGAVQRHANQTFVFVHQGGGSFRRVDVTIGREAGGRAEITTGLQAGQPVAVSGGFALKTEMLRAVLAAD